VAEAPRSLVQDLRPENHLDPVASAVLWDVALGSYLALLCLALVARRRWRQRAARTGVLGPARGVYRSTPWSESPGRQLARGEAAACLRRAGLHGRVAALLGGALLLATAALSGYHLERWAGRSDEAVIGDLRVEIDDDGLRHHRVQLQPRGAEAAFGEEVPAQLATSLSPGQAVPIRFVPGARGLAHLGAGATYHVGLLVLLLGPLLVVSFGWALKTASRR